MAALKAMMPSAMVPAAKNWPRLFSHVSAIQSAAACTLSLAASARAGDGLRVPTASRRAVSTARTLCLRVM